MRIAFAKISDDRHAVKIARTACTSELASCEVIGRRRRTASRWSSNGRSRLLHGFKRRLE